MAGNEDVDGDVSGEEAAWRELIARFDLPVDTETAHAPWPARENLTETARDRQLPDHDAEGGWEDAGPAAPGGRSAPASRPGPAGLPGPASLTGPSLRPSPPDAGADGTAQNDAGRDSAGRDSAGREDTVREKDADTADQSGNGHPGDRARIIRRAEPVQRPQPADEADDDDSDDRYIPPPPEPLPQLDPVGKAAWLGVLGGPGYLLVAQLAGWEISDFSALLAIIAFIAGFATLVVRMSDRPRDDDDDGAVV